MALEASTGICQGVLGQSIRGEKKWKQFSYILKARSANQIEEQSNINNYRVSSPDNELIGPTKLVITALKIMLINKKNLLTTLEMNRNIRSWVELEIVGYFVFFQYLFSKF